MADPVPALDAAYQTFPGARAPSESLFLDFLDQQVGTVSDLRVSGAKATLLYSGNIGNQATRRTAVGAPPPERAA